MMGRPEKAESEKRKDVLRIRLTATERRAIEKAAKARTLEASTWARMVLLETARPAANRASGEKG